MNKVIRKEFRGWTDDLVALEPDIVYSDKGDRKLKLHLVQPIEFYFSKLEGYPILKRYPVVVFAAGSGFTHPEYKGTIGRAFRIAEHGFLVAMVEYSNFLEGNTFLDTCKDFKTAIRFLRVNADQYHIDPDRFIAWGTSSGGTNAQFAAFSGNDPKYKTDEYPEYDDSVCAVVSVSAPSHLQSLIFSESPVSKLYLDYWKDHPQEKSCQELCDEASTINLVGETPLPPVMLVHGTKDLHVPFSQTEELYKKLSEFGHDAVFYQVENGGHSSVFTSEILDIGIAFAKDASQRR